MEQKIDRQKMLTQFECEMKENEKSKATIYKYLHEAEKFLDFVGEGNPITKNITVEYKQKLAETYAISSTNTMLSALNRFLCIIGCQECTVKSFKVQRSAFRERNRELSKEEYIRLVETAKRKGMVRLCLIMQTICTTGIRISELPFITVDSLYTCRAEVSLKGKTRVVILPTGLCKELKQYTNQHGIISGSVFVTRNGKPLDRSNILHQMQSLCDEANVDRSKVFPHNLRHLFALTYYNVEKDICHLADLLGHSSINTTRIYTLVSCEEQERQINELGLLV